MEDANDDQSGGDEEMPDSETTVNSRRHAEGRRILQIHDLENQYLMVRARLRLAQVSWVQGMLRVGSTSLRDLYSALIATALFEVCHPLSPFFISNNIFLKKALTFLCVRV